MKQVFLIALFAISLATGYAKDSSSSCSVCSELSEIQQLLQEEFPCDAPIVINQVPIVITESGKYCVTEDLVYTGSDIAILVTSDNVTINFADHNLTLTSSSAQGIVVQDASEFVLLNDRIEGASLFKTATSASVHLINVTKATISNIFTLNTTKGIWIEDSEDVFVTNSFFKFHEGLDPAATGVSVLIDSSQSVTIDHATFEGASLDSLNSKSSSGLQIQGTSQNIELTNSSFTGQQISIAAYQVNGLLIENVLAIASNVTEFSLAQFGSSSDDAQANNITILNSEFIQPVSINGFDGLLFLNGSGAHLENVVVDTQASIGSQPYEPAGIHFGCAFNGACIPEVSFNNALATNCIVKGNVNGLYVENGSNITFEKSQFTDAFLLNIIFGQGSSCSIKDSTITNGASGIRIDQGSGRNAIVNCTINSNAVDGIVIVPTSPLNLLRGNRVWNHTQNGIQNLGTDTMTFFNTSCYNGTDCVNVSPEQFPGQVPAVAGSNVCCDFSPG